MLWLVLLHSMVGQRDALPRRQTVLIHAFITSIWALPEPTIFLVFDCLDEEFADFVGGGLGIAMLAHDNASQLLFVPIRHGILLLLIFFILPGIRVERPLFGFPLDSKVVGEFTFSPLLAVSLFEKLA